VSAESWRLNTDHATVDTTNQQANGSDTCSGSEASSRRWHQAIASVAPSTASPTATPYDSSTSRRVPPPARGRNRISAWPKSAWVRIDTSSISEIRALPRPTSSGVDVRAATIQ
jgi:hypothetical protein